MKKMTKQITIKLNEERFRPLLDDLINVTGLEKSYSEAAAKSIWMMHKMTFEKVPEWGNKTRLQLLMEKRGISFDEAVLRMLKDYKEFCSRKRTNLQ